MRNQLDRVLKLVKRTGDRLVVFDQADPRNAYVVMNIDEYEMLVDNPWDREDGFYSDEWRDNDSRKDHWCDENCYKYGCSDDSWRKDNWHDDYCECDDDDENDYYSDKMPEIPTFEDDLDDELDNEDIEDIFSGMPDDSDDFSPEAGDLEEKSDDFAPFNDIPIVELDSNNNYGKIENDTEYKQKNKKDDKRWNISKDIKEKQETELVEEKDRYYLENIE